MRTRNALGGALVAVVLVPGAGQAAPTRQPQMVDARGDSVGGHPDADILDVLWTTTGRTAVVTRGGVRRTVYTPDTLVVRMNLAGLPGEAPLQYRTAAEADGCGTLLLTYTAGTVASEYDGNALLFSGCGRPNGVPSRSDFVPDVEHRAARTSITWRVPLRDLPKEVRPGTLLVRLRASVEVVDPVWGQDGTTVTGTPLDRVHGTVDWRLGA